MIRYCANLPHAKYVVPKVSSQKRKRSNASHVSSINVNMRAKDFHGIIDVATSIVKES